MMELCVATTSYSSGKKTSSELYRNFFVCEMFRQIFESIIYRDSL